LFVTASRGVSNRATGTYFRVSVGAGRLLVTLDQPEHPREETPK